MRGLAVDTPKEITTHRFFRPLICIVSLLLVMQALKSQWSSMRGRQGSGSEIGGDRARRLVVAHFMLGNTYPFTDADWETTFDQAEETGLDGLALNLGPEDWQHSQALAAFRFLRSRPSRYISTSDAAFPPGYSRAKIELFISMDMNVLPKQTDEDGERLRVKVSELLKQDGYLHWQGRKVLSTFSGHDASFGGKGWEGWLRDCEMSLGEKVFFWPSFFLPPSELLSSPSIDGIFNWNAAWPINHQTITLEEDQPFLPNSRKAEKAHGKAYMASVSPVFFTHYGTTGQWAWSKNWIYPSDNLLYPTRWQQLLDLSPTTRPDIVQIISWNDHGESHAIAPVVGAQPGSESWTDGMSHEAFRSMTAFFIRQWKAEANRVDHDNEAIRVWLWYRTHPKDLVATDDEVGIPDKADWAEDLINLFVSVPSALAKHGEVNVAVRNGKEHRRSLESGTTNAFVIPFVPGPVQLAISIRDKVLLSADGKRIDSEIKRYNFNMWSGMWTLPLDRT